MAATEPNDESVIRRILDGDTEAFGILVRRHQEHVFRLLSRHLPRAEVAEAAQEAFLDAFQNLGRLRDPGKFRSWLSAIALRRGADVWRATFRRREVDVDFTSPQEQAWLEEVMSDGASEGFEALAGRREAAKLVDVLMDGLGEQDRLALELFYAEEYGVSEIAEMLGWGLSKVKVRLHRARKRMARKFEALTAGK